jgi:hypothetical protein
MGKFTIKRKLSLAYLGEGWEEAYVTFSPPQMAELLEQAKYESAVDANKPETATATYEFGRKLLATHFLEGVGYAGEKDDQGKPKLVPITTEDVQGELFLELYRPILNAFRGVPDQNL